MKVKIVLSIIIVLMTLKSTSSTIEESFDSELNKCKNVVEKQKVYQNVSNTQIRLKDEIIAKFEASITQLKNQIVGYKAKENITEQISKSISQSKTTIEEISRLKASLIDTGKNLNVCEQKLKDNKSELNAEKEKLSELSDAIKKKDEEIRTLKEKIRFGTEAMIQIRQLESRNKECTVVGDGMTQQIKQLKTQINTKDAEIEKLRGLGASNSNCDEASSCEAFGDSSSVHAIQVPGVSAPFKVLCDGQLSGPGWTVIQRRIDGSVSFNRNWTEYRNGFGELSGEFFIGLEKLHHMTKAAPQELYVHLEDFHGQTRYAKYDNFEVGSEEESYVLRPLGVHAGNLSDTMRCNEGAKFTTFDREVDMDSKNLAESLSGAWWYGKCGDINLNGVYQISDTNYDVEGQGVFWFDENWHPVDYSLKTVQLMIRARKVPAAKELYRSSQL